MRLFVFVSVVLFAFSAFAAEGLSGKHNTKQPIEIDADALEVSQNDKTAVFSGNVVAKQGDITINSDKMKVFYGQGADKKNTITKIEVTGNVQMKTPTESAKGDVGVYDTLKNVLNLNGNVVLKRDNNIIKGSSLVVDMTSGKSRIDSSGAASSGGGRVRGLFVPEGATGQ